MNDDFQSDITSLTEDAQEVDAEAFAELKALADEGDIEAEIMVEQVLQYVDFDEMSDQDGDDTFD